MRGAARTFLLAVVIASGCRAQSAQEGTQATRSLASFGARGDGRTDDTSALKRALEASNRYCLDGGGRSYRVTGTLRAAKDLCLRNLTLVQAALPMNAGAYVLRRCPSVQDPSAAIDCGDPPVPAAQFGRLWDSLSIRTLLIRPGGSKPLRVSLDHVKVDRGSHPEGGSRADSAGIWLDGADRVDFRNVEITGAGKGYGLSISNARNVSLTNLWVHDLVWAPYRGDAPLSEARVRAIGWNAVPIHEFREPGRSGDKLAKAFGVRIQEQLTCVSLANVTHVRIENVRVERCLARFDSGDLPWQADGLDIGRSSSDVVINGARIDSTWEGMDVVAGGSGIDGLVINDAQISNSFSFGLKMGYQLRGAKVSNVRVTGAGLSGIVFYGPVRGVRITGATISEVGAVRRKGGTFSPWPAGNRAGVRIDGTAASAPQDVVLDGVTVSGQPARYEFGILNTGGKRIQVVKFRAAGSGSAAARGIEPAQR